MNSARILLVLSLGFAPAAVGCSHDDDMHGDHATAYRSTGDEHGDGNGHAHVAGSRVTTRDTDHDGMDDTVAVRGTGRTATDQGESPSDVEITRQIRSAVVGDSSLSFGARNCVIITNGGHVTLRGNATAAESAAIERHAMAAAGVLHVENDLQTTDETPAPH